MNDLWRSIKSFRFALQGIRTAFLTQSNFRIHTFFTLVAIVASIVFPISKTEWLIVILLIGLVTSLELINTGLEFLTDLVSPEYHDLAKKSKDTSAAAVFIAALTAFVCGLVIFLPYFLEVVVF